ncbi:MAG: GGDEF domain-containing protein [Methylobacterium mesophilicum]|nr:GGDEF domain-containing protein [Methylobacterium mesophilicum]
MSFHKSELAFFVFVTIILGAGMVTLHAYGVVQSARGATEIAIWTERTGYLSRLLFGMGVLIAAAVLFGVFFIYPLLRTQALEENKLREMAASLSARSQTLEQAALTDSLTGVHNRRYFDDALQEYLEEFGRIEKPVGLMLLDLDHFKSVNDSHGHDVGDEVLRAVAGCLKDMTRYHDVVARLGGEEFAVLGPNMDAEHLVKLADRIRRAVAGLVISSGNVRLRVTTSVGLAVWDGKETGEDFVRRADQQLYEAKRRGRNRVCA